MSVIAIIIGLFAFAAILVGELLVENMKPDELSRMGVEIRRD